MPPTTCSYCRLRSSPDYKRPEILRNYIDHRGRIKPRAKTQLCPAHQRSLAAQVKLAREMALLPFLRPKVRKS